MIGSEAVVTQGLTVGETVITDGQMRVVPGSRVEPRPKTSKAKSGNPSSES
jgi:multidrug efflux pump subunit AcrA (membrane-fusion protein)